MEASPNPLAHLDLFGSLMLLVVGFGWAKPVPIDARYFRSPRRDLALVAFAGPLSNIILATVIGVVFRIVISGSASEPNDLLAGAQTDDHPQGDGDGAFDEGPAEILQVLEEGLDGASPFLVLGIRRGILLRLRAINLDRRISGLPFRRMLVR